MNSRAISRRLCLPAALLAALTVAGLVAGCASSPKLSLSPATWPGAKQVAGVGQKVGDLVTRQDKESRDAKTAGVASAGSRQPLGDSTKGRPFLAHRKPAGDRGPVDPFLQQTAQARPGREDVSPSSDAQYDGLPLDRQSRAADHPFQRAAHAFDGPQETTTDEIASAGADAPVLFEKGAFADLAGPRSAPEAGTQDKRREANAFVDGFDSQLDQLRGGPGRSGVAQGRPATRRNLPVESNPLRDAILGLPDDADSAAVESAEDIGRAAIVAQPAGRAAAVAAGSVDFPPESDRRTTRQAAPDRGTFASDDVADQSLPDWARPKPARRSPFEPSESEEQTTVATPARGDALDEMPLPESPGTHAVAFDRQQRRESSQEPLAAESIATSPPAMRSRPPSAIEIVPAATKAFGAQSPEDRPSDSRPAKRVVLLPAPVEEDEEFADAPSYTNDFVDREDDGDSYGGMIVESGSLPSGFAEWQGEGTRAALHTNAQRAAGAAGSPSRGKTPARLPANPGQASKNPWASGKEDFSDIGSGYEPPADPKPRPVQKKPARATGEDERQDQSGPAGDRSTSIEPRLFRSPDDRGQPVQNALAAVNWAPESEPRARAGSWALESTAIIGLLIGLACLTGLALLRRVRVRI